MLIVSIFEPCASEQYNLTGLTGTFRPKMNLDINSTNETMSRNLKRLRITFNGDCAPEEPDVNVSRKYKTYNLFGLLDVTPQVVCAS